MNKLKIVEVQIDTNEAHSERELSHFTFYSMQFIYEYRQGRSLLEKPKLVILATVLKIPSLKNEDKNQII